MSVEAVVAESDGPWGRVEPRISTGIPVGAVDLVDRVDGRAAQYLGSGLDPWQRVFVRHLSADRGGGLPAPEVGLTVARQNGKSWVMLAYILDQLLEGKRVVHCAQRIDLARSHWQLLNRLFDPKEQVAPPLASLHVRSDKSRGNERLDLVNGGMYRVVAANGEASRGLDAIDLVFMDETRSQRTWEAFAALEPTLTTSPAPQLVMASNAGSEQSVVLNAWRDRGRLAAAGAADDPIVWCEWSAHPDRALDDVDGWAEANPNLGHRFPVSRLQATRRTLADDPNLFRTERMCQWIGADEPAIDRTEWHRLGDPDLPPPKPGDPGLVMVLAVDPPPAKGGAVLMLGRQLPDGRVAVGVLDKWVAEPGGQVSDRDLADTVVERWRQWRPTRVGYNKHTAAGAVHLLTRRSLPLVDLKGSKFFDGCGLMAELVSTGMLVHTADPLVDEQVGWAGRELMRNGNGWFLSRRRSPGPIYAADAVAMIAWLASKRHGSPTGVITLNPR